MTGKTTVSEVFFETAQKFAESPFLHAPRETATIYELAKTDYTYAEARAIVEKLAAQYRTIGAAPGIRVGLGLDNRPEFFLHFLALNSLGASILPLNCAMQREELLYQIDHSECALIVAAPSHRALLAEIADGATRRPQIVLSDDISAAKKLPAAAAPGAGEASSREAAILYTSGTTGKPKGCILSNDYFVAIGDLYVSLGGHIEFTLGKERIITPLPATHMNALACSFMAAIQTGGCLIQLDRFHPKSWWKTVRESRATIMHYLGVMPAMLLKAAEAPDDDFSGQVKFAFGAGCDPR
ncbi:MAG: AMP-binding protein, partial [Pseudomonadota bacterium]